MRFTDLGNKKVIEFDEEDTDEEKRILEQNLAILRNLFVLIKKR